MRPRKACSFACASAELCDSAALGARTQPTEIAQEQSAARKREYFMTQTR